MYNLEGSDDDREWIEIKNISFSPVDISTWRFEEGGTQHKLTVYSGSPILDSNQFAVIVDDGEKFKNDNPNFFGTIIDSSFSLANTSEKLILRDHKDGDIIDEFTYSSELGASGDGNSLQKNSSGNFVPAAPSPGRRCGGSSPGRPPPWPAAPPAPPA